MESVHHTFFTYVAFKMGTVMRSDKDDFSDIAYNLNFESLKSIHDYYDFYFGKKLKLNLLIVFELFC